jgi:hypothetical protein
MPPAASFKKLGKLNIHPHSVNNQPRVFSRPAARWSGEFERAESPFKKLTVGLWLDRIVKYAFVSYNTNHPFAALSRGL